MKVLLDGNTPAPLARHLNGHDVSRSGKFGWQALTNGDLLGAAEQSCFELLITCDQNLTYQQNLDGKKVALLILSRNNWQLVRRSPSRIATAVDFIQRGHVVRIEIER